MSASLLDFINKDNVNIVTLTSGTTYNKPTNLHRAFMIVTGPGGNGGDATQTGGLSAAGGGGAGATVMKFFNDADIGASETITIPTSGSPTTVGALLSAASGVSAVTSINNLTTQGAVGGVATGGDINLDGGDGNSSCEINISANSAVSGQGGASFWGGGPTGVTISGSPNGNPGKVYGSGGSGAAVTASGTPTGGAGKTGIVVIIEFLNP